MLEDALNLRDILLGALITLSVLLVFNSIKNRLDRRSMRRDMASLLYNELRANLSEVRMCKHNGLSERHSVVNGVYNGLVSSGNMKYLKDYQMALYKLYISMERNDKNAETLISDQMEALQKIFERIL